MADVLSDGRLQIGLGAGVPAHAGLIGDPVFDGDSRPYDPRGERPVLAAPDVVGIAEQILGQLPSDAVLCDTTELRLELPYEFHSEDYWHDPHACHDQSPDT